MTRTDTETGTDRANLSEALCRIVCFVNWSFEHTLLSSGTAVRASQLSDGDAPDKNASSKINFNSVQFVHCKHSPRV